MESLSRYTTADALLEAFEETGISYLFSNLGSDHPALIEGLAKAKALGRPLPKVIISPHEYVALSAAHGYYQLSGQAQGVIVHTDVGTQNLGGSLHNAARSRVPVFIFSGETPSTMEGELAGSRNSPINYLQNVYDQRGIVRGYVKWEYDIRTGKNVKQLVYRAMQIANTEPKGPVYLTGAREVLEEEVQPKKDLTSRWKPKEPTALTDAGIEQIFSTLANSKNPILITSYLGRNIESVDLLVEFCELLSIPVIESNPSYMNYPTEHPLHMGFEGGDLLDNADVVVVLDCDVPWIPTVNDLNDSCKVIFIDNDPIKEKIPLAYIPADLTFQADSYHALTQLLNYAKKINLDHSTIEERFSRLKERHNSQRKEWRQREVFPTNGVITPEWVSRCLRNVIDEDTIILNETITSTSAIFKGIPRIKPGTMFGNGGSSLGWNGGAAIGAKLAQPNKTVVSLTGDGTYLFSVPSSVHWMSRKYNAPFLTIIFNNQGWNATKMNLLKQHPDGIAKRDDHYWVNFDKPADLAKIAEAAGGAFAQTISKPEELESALKNAIEIVNSGQSAVIDVKMQPISYQVD